MTTRQERIEALTKDWAENKRWEGIERGYQLRWFESTPAHHLNAGMAELADAHDSGSCVLTDMQVQVLFPAHKEPLIFKGSSFRFGQNTTTVRLPYDNAVFTGLR